MYLSACRQLSAIFKTKFYGKRKSCSEQEAIYILYQLVLMQLGKRPYGQYTCFYRLPAAGQ